MYCKHILIAGTWQ